MKTSRLEHLYRRNLVTDDKASRHFPERWVMSQEIKYFPAKPTAPRFDILEIGPGRGDFLFTLAQAHPEQSILAIERGTFRYLRLVERVKKQGFTNVTIAGGDARIPLNHDLKEVRFGKIYVLFPDPWPRNRHRHKRLLTETFIANLCDKLEAGGEFTLATDVEDYARWVMGHFEKMTGMQNVQGADITRTPLPDLIPTFFEQKWREMGRICHYVRYRKSPAS